MPPNLASSKYQLVALPSPPFLCKGNLNFPSPTILNFHSTTNSEACHYPSNHSHLIITFSPGHFTPLLSNWASEFLHTRANLPPPSPTLLSHYSPTLTERTYATHRSKKPTPRVLMCAVLALSLDYQLPFVR